jgi:hypothetical protein
MGRAREPDLLGGRQQRRDADLVQINLGDVLDEAAVLGFRRNFGILVRPVRSIVGSCSWRAARRQELLRIAGLP